MNSQIIQIQVKTALRPTTQIPKTTRILSLELYFR